MAMAAAPRAQSGALPGDYASVVGRPALPKVGVVGAGEVVRQKYLPGLAAADLTSLTVVSREPVSPVQGVVHEYLPLPPGRGLPIADLRGRGLLGADTLWIIATPSTHHAEYVEQLAPHTRVAVEKPIANSAAEARRLRRFTSAGYGVYPIDHKLFNSGPLAAIARLRDDPAPLGRAARVQGLFYERAGFAPGRQQEDGIADVQWHLLTVLRALFTAAGMPGQFKIQHAAVAMHGPDSSRRYQQPTVWTASRLVGRLVSERSVWFDCRQAKAAPTDTKVLRFLDDGGEPVLEVDLNESGWRAHARLLAALRAPTVDVYHTLADAIDLADAVDEARLIAIPTANYPIGELPSYVELPRAA